MFTLTRLTVEGFRGFRNAEDFEFDQPATELFGDNATCKSSTLNAIEWALFSDECAGKQTGIRERIGWTIPNRYLPVPGVRVQLEMDGPGGTYVIVRMLRRLPRRAAAEEVLELTLPDGTTLDGDAASEKLAALLQSSFRDFLTTVYQHQEAIRAVVTQEPKDRNDAIDRLLGLSDHRNLLSALDQADVRGGQKDLAREFSAFEEQVAAGLAARENDLATLRQEAEDAGLSRNKLTAKVAIDLSKAVAMRLQAFAKEAELDLTEISAPEQWDGLAQFERLTRREISRLRGLVPGTQEQETLLKRQEECLAVKAALEQIRQRKGQLSSDSQALDKEHGGRKAVATAIQQGTKKLEDLQKELRRTNGRAAVIKEAIEFLDTVGDEEPPCPVCETPVAGLTDKLQELWTKKLKVLVERISGKIDEVKARLREVRAVARRYEELDNDSILLEQQTGESRQKAAELVGIELDANADPLAVIGKELNRMKGRLQQLGNAIQERQDRLNTIEEELGWVCLIYDYLHQEEKKKVLETIQESQAFKQLESVRDEVAQLVEDCEAIKIAVAEVAREGAEDKLTAAGKTIDEYFRQLSRNSAITELKLAIAVDKRTRRNSYEITDQDGEDLTPILSQGDLNALALAIFLGLAATASESGRFGFLMLDDPSQSLGTEHKKQLASLLDRVARHKKVIIATMDGEFHECLAETFTMTRKEYRFGEWTPDEGPSISVHEPVTGDARAASRRVSKVPLRR